MMCISNRFWTIFWCQKASQNEPKRLKNMCQKLTILPTRILDGFPSFGNQKITIGPSNLCFSLKRRAHLHFFMKIHFVMKNEVLESKKGHIFDYFLLPKKSASKSNVFFKILCNFWLAFWLHFCPWKYLKGSK